MRTITGSMLALALAVLSVARPVSPAEVPAPPVELLAAPSAAEPCAAAGALPPRAALDLACALPGGELELAFRAGRYATLACAGDGRYSCEELPRVPLAPAPPPRAGLAGCALPADDSLECTLRALGAPSPAALTLRGVPGGAAAGLLPRHVRGLTDLSSLTLVGSSPGAPPSPLPSAALRALPALRRLTIRNARLQLQSDAFANLTDLEFLEISVSELKDLEPGVLRGLSSLRTLSLWGNSLPALKAGALRGLTALDTLDLSSNPLPSLGAGVLAEVPKLRTLRLVDTGLKTLDESATSGLAALEELSIFDAREKLVLGARAISLPALRFVQIERCGVEDLPEDALENAHSLRSLSLAHNALSALPAGLLRTAGELRALNLSRNALVALTPALLAPLTRLETLHLDHNLLEVFPDDLFGTSGALRTLTARHNRLRVVAPTAMAGARALASLDLAHNRLAWGGAAGEAGAVVPEAAGGAQYEPALGEHSPLGALLALRRLDLGDNLIAAVFGDWRYVLLNLELLNLTRNRLDYLTDADINFISTKIVVDLRYNNISTVQLFGMPQDASSDGDEGAAPEESPARVLLDGNPFRCDCHTPALQRRLADARARPRLEPGAAVCAAPPPLAGLALAAAPPAALACPLPAPACPAACACRLRPHAAALELACEHAVAAAPDPADFGLARTVLKLNSAPPSLNLSFPVHELVLAGLGLTKVPPGPASPILELLDLSDNRLTEIPPAPGPNLRMAGNPLSCDCEHAKALGVAQRDPRRIVDWKDVSCARGGPLWRVDTARLCAGAGAAWAAGAGAALALLGLLAAAAAALWLRHRRELKVFLFARGWCGWLTRAAEEPAARYDVFVSFSHEDEALVARELAPALERRGYRLCLHYRDWAPGEAIAAHVERSVREARRTLVLVSPAFLRSEWARAEFRAAHARALRDGRARVLVVLLGAEPAGPAAGADDDLAAYLRTNTYLRWGDPWFWQKLQYALPHRPLGGKPAPGALAGSLANTLAGSLANTLAGAPDKLAPPLEPRLVPPPAV